MEHKRGLKKRPTGGEKQPTIKKDKAGRASFFCDHAVELWAAFVCYVCRVRPPTSSFSLGRFTSSASFFCILGLFLYLLFSFVASYGHTRIMNIQWSISYTDWTGYRQVAACVRMEIYVHQPGRWFDQAATVRIAL